MFVRPAFRRFSIVTVTLVVVGVAAAWPRAQTPGAPAQSLFKDLKWRNIGPANMSGRVTDIEALEANPAVV